MHKIAIIGLEGCLGSTYLGLLDLLSLANRAIAQAQTTHEGEQSNSLNNFSFLTASLSGQAFEAGAYLHFDVETSLEEITICDAIIIPSFSPTPGGKPPDMSVHAATAAWLRRHHSRGAIVGGCGSGVFLLGEAGLFRWSQMHNELVAS